MKDYYLVPMTSEKLGWDGKSLKLHLKEKYPVVYEKELLKEEIENNKYDKFGNVTKEYKEILPYIILHSFSTYKTYDLYEIPEHIIIYIENHHVYEYATHKKLISSVSDPNLLGKPIDKYKFYDFLRTNPNYEEDMQNYFNKKEAKVLSMNLYKKNKK